MHAENPRYTVRDVKEERSKYRRGMEERIKDYMDEVYQEDRRIARPDQWEEARQMALATEEAETLQANAPTSSPEGDGEVMKLLEKFRRRDRGEI